MAMTLDKQRKKELSTAYSQSFRRMGVYQIRNTVNGKIYVDGSMDLDGSSNRVAFMKQMKMNSIIALNEDWNKYGPDAFVYEELDWIEPQEEVLSDRGELKAYKDEVDALLDLWLDKLQPYGEQGYNKPKRK
jgi:hypothetical protein